MEKEDGRHHGWNVGIDYFWDCVEKVSSFPSDWNIDGDDDNVAVERKVVGMEFVASLH